MTIIMKKDIAAESMKTAIPVGAAAAVDADPSLHFRDAMSEKSVVPITEGHLTTELSLILPMIAASRWNLSAEPVR